MAIHRPLSGRFEALNFAWHWRPLFSPRYRNLLTPSCSMAHLVQRVEGIQLWEQDIPGLSLANSQCGSIPPANHTLLDRWRQSQERLQPTVQPDGTRRVQVGHLPLHWCRSTGRKLPNPDEDTFCNNWSPRRSTRAGPLFHCHGTSQTTGSCCVVTWRVTWQRVIICSVKDPHRPRSQLVSPTRECVTHTLSSPASHISNLFINYLSGPLELPYELSIRR